jgi:hypothetical protein
VRKWLLLVFPTVILLALIVVDQAAKGWAETKLAERAAAYYPPGARSSASIDSFPFLGRLLFLGSIPRVEVNLDDLQVVPVVIRELSLRVSDVKLDRGEIFGGNVRLEDVGRGAIVATVDGPSLAGAVGLDVRFAPGEVTVRRRIEGVDAVATGTLAVQGNLVTFTPTSVQGSVPLSLFAISYRIPGVELLPCDADVDVEVRKDALVLACQVTDVPAALVQAAQTGG